MNNPEYTKERGIVSIVRTSHTVRKCGEDWEKGLSAIFMGIGGLVFEWASKAYPYESTPSLYPRDQGTWLTNRSMGCGIRMFPCSSNNFSLPKSSSSSVILVISLQSMWEASSRGHTMRTHGGTSTSISYREHRHDVGRLQ